MNIDNLLKFIKNIFIFVSKEGLKGLKKYILLIIAILLFLSPMVVFSLTFGKKLYIGLAPYEKIVLDLILNTLLFVLLYIVGSIRKTDFKNNDRTLFNVTLTLLLMALISLLIVVSYLIYNAFTGDIEVKIGILLLFLFILLIIAYYSLQWASILRELTKNLKIYNENKQPQKENKDKNDNAEIETMTDF